MPGRDLSTDKKKMGFKGQNAGKLRITYKNEGGGLKCYCIFDDGYNFTLYFHNKPAPKKWLEKGKSPFHSRCIALFD